MHCESYVCGYSPESYSCGWSPGRRYYNPPGLIKSLELVMGLGKTVKDAIVKQGMLAWQYNTIGVSDAITMGGEGMCLHHDPITVC